MNRILIVEDQRLEKQYMESIIESDGRCTLAGTLSNAAAAEIFCQGHSVDLILMDICTENHENGLDAAAVIKRSSPEIKIVIVTSTVKTTLSNAPATAASKASGIRTAVPRSLRM